LIGKTEENLLLGEDENEEASESDIEEAERALG
jgi:hypothetical protein